MRVSVIGAAGYAGAELVRLLLRHPEVHIDVLTSETFAGQRICEVYRELQSDIQLRPLELEAIDSPLVFTALPHGKSAAVVGRLVDEGKRVIDFSADFRLRSVSAYESWYGAHPRKDLLDEAVYGLPELYRISIAAGRLIANPGCYPTGALLALAPIDPSWLASTEVIVDAKSGVTGAGRKLTLTTHFPEINENMLAYAVTGHRHLPEIEEQLTLIQGRGVRVRFVPHLIPVNRGILSTCYLSLTTNISPADVHRRFAHFYEDEKFVCALPEGEFPSTKAVAFSNRCLLGLHVDPAGRLTVVSAIDNLGKGAAGQAIQNMNTMCGFPETMGL